jgi:hypothetical protein
MRRWVLLLLLLALPGRVWAASAQYVNPGAAVTFQDSAGTAVLTFNNKATNNGHISDRVDLGDPHSPWYILACTFRQNTAGTVGTRVEFYLAWSNGTHPDGELGTSNATIASTNSLLNLKPALVVVADKTTTNSDISGSTLVNIPTQYVQVAYMNLSGVNLQATANVSLCSLTPAPLEQQ